MFSGNTQSVYDTLQVGRWGFCHCLISDIWVPDGFSVVETEGCLQMDLDV